MKIKIIPNVLSKAGRSEFSPDWSAKKTVREYLKDLNIKTRGQRVIVSGKKLTKLSVILKPTDEIIVTPKIKDPFTIGLATMAIVGISSMGVPTAAFALTATIVGWAVIGAVVGIAALAIVSAFQQPRRPTFGTMNATGGGIDAASPTYGWDGVQTTQNVGTPVPVVYGEHKVGGNVINQFITNDGDKNYLHTLLALSEGEIESISDIQINDNPIENFEGVTTEQVLGTNSQDPILGYELLHDINTVAVNLNDMDDSHVYTMAGNDLLGFEVLVTFPAGLYYMANSGGVSEGQCILKIEYKLHTDVDWTLLDTYTIASTNRSAVRRIFRKLGLTPGQYDVRLTRLTAIGDTNNIRDMAWTHLDELRDDSLIYPNTALLGMSFLATDQLSGGTPNITAIVKGKKISIPDIQVSDGGARVPWEDYYFDPATEEWKLLADDSVLFWNGVSYVTAFCANPVWVILDLMTNTRYGIGEFIDTSHVDMASFLEMAKYCDGKVADGNGGWEKRFRMDVVLDSDSRSIDTLMQLATTFRAIFFFSDNSIQLKIDKPELPVQLFTMGNIIANSFMQKWKSIKEVPNEMQIQFLDKTKSYQQEMISFMDESAVANGAVVRKKQIRLFCTRISQAVREARYLLYFSKYVDRSITFKAGIDALACQVGDVIDFSHDVPQWGFSGRVVSFADGVLTLDRPMTIVDGVTYKVRVRHSDDTFEERTISNIAGVAAALTVTEPFTTDPAPYEIYAFGAANALTKPFRIMSIQREINNEVQITAVEYNASVYDDSAPALPTDNFSALPKQIANVTGLLLTESAIKTADGTIVGVLDAWFNKPDDSEISIDYQYDKARVYVSNNNRASWRYAGETYGNHFQVQNVLVGQKYFVAVVSVAKNSMQNTIAYSPYDSLTITGKTEPPESVSSFICYQRRDSLLFGWTPVSDLDLRGYEIRKGGSWESGYVVGVGLTGQSFETNSVIVESGQSFWIKAVDTNGNYSEEATEATISVETLPFQNVVMEFTEENDNAVTFQSFGEDGFDDVGESRFSDTAWTGAKTNMEVSGTSLVFSAGQLSGTYVTHIRDVGYVAPFRIALSTIFTLAGDDTWQSFGEDTFQTNQTRRFSGQETTVGMVVRIRTSEDNITWTDWMAWADADFKCRYFQLEFTFTRASTDQAAECSSLKYIADLPDVDEFGGDAVLVAGDGKQVLFSKTFHEAPIVAISILAGDGKVSSFSVAPTITGFTVKLYDLAGVAVTGQFAYHAHGI